MKAHLHPLQNHGMSRDISVSKAENTFAWENFNVRITQQGDDTLLSVTNERGTKFAQAGIGGTIIGWNALNDKLVVFSVSGSTSNIVRVGLFAGDSDSLDVTTVAWGNFGFSTQHPIESILSYESEEVQKVYWVDGVHVLRSCNIMHAYGQVTDTTLFDSTRGAKAALTITTEKDNGGSTRANGVIQYFVTAYDKLGVETGIVGQSSLIYLSPINRGGAADETNSNRVMLTISSASTLGFEFIRVYALLRNSKDGQLTAYIISENPVPTRGAATIEVTDVGANYLGTVDPSVLLFLGSKEVIAATMTQKDNTLFLGNLDVPSNDYTSLDDWAASIRSSSTGLSNIVSFTTQAVEGATFSLPEPGGSYSYYNQLNLQSDQFKLFKAYEKYRFAVVFRKANGDRSKAFWIGDAVCPMYPDMYSVSGKVAYSIPKATITTSLATAMGYEYAQLYMAKATYADRAIKAQGFLNPTVYNLYDRYNNQPYARPSWILRPMLGNAEFMHLSSLRNSSTKYGELQSNWWDTNRYRSYYTMSNGEITGYIPEAWQSLPDYAEELVGYTGVGILMSWSYNSAHTKFGGTIGNCFIVIYRTQEDPLPPAPSPFSDSSEQGWETIRVVSIEPGITGGCDWNVFKEYAVSTCKSDPILSLYYPLNYTQMDGMKNNLPSGASEATFVDQEAIPLGARHYKLDSASLFSLYSRQNYFIDSNIVSFHSPEIEYETINLDKNSNVKIRVIGAAPISSSITDSDMQVVDSDYVGNNVVKYNYSSPYGSSSIGTLMAAPMYYDSLVQYNTDGTTYPRGGNGYYMTYLWHKTGSIINYTDSNGKAFAKLVTKRFANLHYAYYTDYVGSLSNAADYSYPKSIRNVSGYSSGVYEIDGIEQGRLYGVNMASTVVMPPYFKYPIYYATLPADNYEDALSLANRTMASDPIQIAYNTRPHIVLSLPSVASSSSVSSVEILPKRYGSNGDDDFNINTELVSNAKAITGESIGLPISTEMRTALLGNGLRVVGTGYVLNTAAISANPQAPKTPLSDSGEVASGVVKPNSTHSSLVITGAFLWLSFDVSPTYSTGKIFFYDAGNNNPVSIYNTSGNIHLGWSDSLILGLSSVHQNTVTLKNNFTSSQPYVWVAELYEDITPGPSDKRYGGITDAAVQNNTFIPCGPEVKMSSGTITLVGNEGDTYFQRYDCLLSYPQSENDTNQPVDIASVMLETHLNLDGRTDKDRGVNNLTDIDYTQFGNINTVYMQENNFLQAKVYDEKFNTGSYPTTITWSLEKHPLETNDTWMNITLASTMTVDSMYGPLNALRRFNNAIIGFQDRGISEILFNSRVQVPASDGVPVELANSGKVEGKRTISNHYGCVNKWSIVEGRSGLYFKDDLSKEIVVFNGQSIDALSTRAKLNAWVQDNTNTEPWTPAAWENTIAFYDNIASDVYFVNSSTREGVTNQHPCLVYNENLGNFVGFFSYGSIPLIANLRDRLITAGGGNSPSLYFMKEGVYNKLLGTYYPSYVIWRVTPDAYSDKIWSNLEYRADFMTMLDMSGNDIYKEGESPTGYGATAPGEYNPDVTFDTVRVWNEYQDTGNINMTWAGPGSLENPNGPDIRKKFRIWRADIPRDSHDSLGLDRIRNPWVWLKVQKNFAASDGTDKMRFQLHDMVVKYFTTD